MEQNENTLSVLKIAPGQYPQQVEIDNDLKALQQAVADGCDIFGYTWWGPIDIVSAGTGEMEKRYGFIYVDKDNQGNGTLQRRKKDSFEYYKKVIASNGQDLELPAED